MSDPFRRHFLDMLELVLKKEPSHDTQLELLQLATPDLDESTLNNHAATKKSFRTLLTRVHPDKHPKDVERATRLCQDVKVFYEKCSLASPEPDKKKRRKSGTPNAFPLEFSSKDEWPYISFDFEDEPKTVRTCAQTCCVVATQCINARGAIVHGKQVQRYYGSEKAIEKAEHAAGSKEVFHKYFGGTKGLCGVEEIKEEIMERGPVVSTSFEPNEAFLNRNSVFRHQKELLIVGWTQHQEGEVWIVQLFSSASALISLTAYISVGQFGVDDCCAAPIDSLENVSWEHGPYFDLDMTRADGWRTSLGIKENFANFGELEPLFKVIGKLNISSVGAVKQEHLICVRDKNKKAHSRTGVLRSIEFIDNKWTIRVDFR